MALKNLLSFSSGELDPILHDRITLEKFAKGLATARNVIIGKTGSILSRFARAHYVKAKNNNEKIKLFSPPNSNVLTEWGNLYVRIYDFSAGTATLTIELSHALLESDLTNMHFTASGKHIYVFVAGKQMLKLLYDDATPAFVLASTMFDIPAAPTSLSITANGAPAGYAVNYLVTKVENGEESLAVEETSTTYKKPDASGQSNTITVIIDAAVANIDKYNEVRIYRRPEAGGAYGFLGSTTDFFDDGGGQLKASFEDLGSLADFTNGYQDSITKLGFDGKNVEDLNPKTGAVYQQRLLISTEDDTEAILASRPGFQNNFFRDFPYDDDSALSFKSGTTGKAEVLRIIDNDGLIVFTTVGIYINVGVLNIDNIALEKKGSWVINEKIPPLAVPGGVFFVEKDTNSIKQLIFSRDISTYETKDHTIFSNHLFKQKTIISWAFQEGITPMIIVSFSDGTFATFTYHFEHQMRAWTRHDSSYNVEQVEGTGVADSTFFVTNKNGQRYIETSLPRFIPAATFASNSEADKLNTNAFMDAVKTQSNLLNDSLIGANVFQLALISGTWSDVNTLTLTCGTSAIFTASTFGAVGTVMRFFDTTDKSTVDLEVISRTDDNTVIVQPSSEFPSAQAVSFRLYETYSTVTGLDHLEGENVGIFLDGYVVNSPYNDVEGYSPVVVSSGTITIPGGERGAIIIVGRPIAADIRTLNISTVEQSPTLIESINVLKLYIRIFETRGLYVNNIFPEEETGGVDGTSVNGMEDMDIFDVPSGTSLIGNRYKEPVSKRVEQTIKGNWSSQGQVAIRQVDPVHFEILSIIPDVEVLRRSDRG